MTNAIEIRGLVKYYPQFQLGPVNLTVPCGAIYGLIGPNGAGKTTLIDLIFGMGKNDAGKIDVLGMDHSANEVAVKRRVAYVGPDLNFSIWGKVGKAIRFVRGFYPGWDDAYCAQLMQAFHLSANDRIITLSFGARTKLSLLLALSRKPDVLILDEPTTGLDAVSKQQIFSELLKVVEPGNRSVLISSHNLSDIERFADHVGMIKNGKLLLEGRTDEVVDRYRFAEFTTSNGTVIHSGEGLYILKQAGHRWQALIDQQSRAQEWLQGQGAGQLSLTRLTLEDLFVALAREEEVK